MGRICSVRRRKRGDRTGGFGAQGFRMEFGSVVVGCLILLVFSKVEDRHGYSFDKGSEPQVL